MFLLDAIQYGAARSLMGLCHAFPPEANAETAALAARLGGALGLIRTERARENLRRAFPHWDERAVREVADESIRSMLRMFMVDMVLLPRLISHANWPDRLELGDIAPGLEILLQGRPALFLSGHFGNFEVMGFFLSTIGLPLEAVARPLDNPLLWRWLLRTRELRGMRVITKWGASEELQASLARGGHVAFIADQNAGDDGIFVPFFDRLASCYKSIGLLAIRYRAPVVVGSAVRIGEALRWRLEVNEVIEPEAWETQEDPLFYLTARSARALETMIRARPEQYWWIHRRWKSRPRFEREGRPMPATLRRRLEALPWMTPSSLARIVQPG